MKIIKIISKHFLFLIEAGLVFTLFISFFSNNYLFSSSLDRYKFKSFNNLSLNDCIIIDNSNILKITGKDPYITIVGVNTMVKEIQIDLVEDKEFVPALSIYYNIGEGFNEKDKITYLKSGKEEFIKIELNKKIKDLRIDFENIDLKKLDNYLITISKIGINLLDNNDFPWYLLIISVLIIFIINTILKNNFYNKYYTIFCFLSLLLLNYIFIRFNINNILQILFLTIIFVFFTLIGINLFIKLFTNSQNNRKIKRLWFYITIWLASFVFCILYWRFIFGINIYAYSDIGSDTIWAYIPSYQSIINKFKERNFSLHNLNMGIGDYSFLFEEFPFILILLFFNENNIYIGLILITYIKYFIIVLFSFYYFKSIKCKDSIACISTLFWCFTGFNVLWGQHYQFLTCIVYFTILMYCLENALKERKICWLLFSMVIAIYSINSGALYFIFSSLIFMGLYILVRALYLKDGLFITLKNLLKYIIYTLWGLLMGLWSSFIWINAFFETSRASIPISINMLFPNLNTHYLITLLGRIFSASTFGINNYSGYSNLYEAPILNTSVLIFFSIVCMVYYNKNNLLIVFGVLISFIFPIVNFIFVLSPDVTRWYFIISFISVICIGKFFDKIDNDNLIVRKSTLLISIILPFGFITILKFITSKLNMYIDNSIVKLEILFILIYYILFMLIYCRKSKVKNMKLVFIIFGCLEIIFSNYSIVNNRGILMVEDFQKYFFINDTKKGIDYIKENDNSLYRIKTYNHSNWPWLNDSKIYNYYGLNTYNSINNKYYYNFINNLDDVNSFYNRAKNPNYLDIATENLAVQTLLGVKYITIDNPDNPPFGYELYAKFNSLNVYKNNNFVPIGFAYYNYIDKERYLSMTTQDKSLSLLSGFYLENLQLSDFKELVPNYSEKNLSEIYFESTKKLQENSAETISYKNGVYRATFNNRSDSNAMFCIPISYSKNWDAMVNDKNVDVYCINDCMIGIILETGKSEIVLEWKINNLNIINLISISSIGIYVFFVLGLVLPKRFGIKS